MAEAGVMAAAEDPGVVLQLDEVRASAAEHEHVHLVPGAMVSRNSKLDQAQ